MGDECLQQSEAVASMDTKRSNDDSPAPIHTRRGLHSRTYISQISDVRPIKHAHALRGAPFFSASNSNGAGPIPGTPSTTHDIVPSPTIREVGESTRDQRAKHCKHK